jgi:hypothetical protein
MTTPRKTEVNRENALKSTGQEHSFGVHRTACERVIEAPGGRRALDPRSLSRRNPRMRNKGAARRSRSFPLPVAAREA